MTLRVIKETKRYGRMDGRTDGQRENSIPPTNKVCGGGIITNKVCGGYNDDILIETKKICTCFFYFILSSEINAY